MLLLVLYFGDWLQDASHNRLVINLFPGAGVFRAITTLYVGGVGQDITEDDIRDQFYSFGEVTSVKKVASRFCAFVTFATRDAAERAAQELHNKLLVKGTRLKLMWGRPQQQRGDNRPAEYDAMQPSTSNRSMMPPQLQQGTGGHAPPNYFNLPGGAAPYYPSMDPTAMGTRVADGKRSGGDEGEDAKKRQKTDTSTSDSGYGYQGHTRPPMGMPPPRMPMPPGMMPGMPMLPPGMPLPPMMPPGMPPHMYMPRPPPGAPRPAQPPAQPIQS